jgi:ubiquitin-protein ligase
MEEIDNVFESILQIPLRNRLKGEYYRMIPLYNSVNIIMNEDGKIIFIIEKKDKDNYNKENNTIYNFVISKNYPFEPPSVYINNKNYGQFLRCPNKFLKILKYIRGIDCLCCNSCICRNNWSPAMSMKHIIEEIGYNKITKFNIMIKILLDKIKQKYLNRDIELDSWLFHVSCPHVIKPGSHYYLQ